MGTNINSEVKFLSAADCERRRQGICYNCSVRMTLLTSEALLPLEACNLLPLFLGKGSSNISFVVDTSEDMRAALGSVKRLLIQTLLTKASLRDSLFNIMTFSHQISCWSPHMLPCVPDTVYKALPWIHGISCSPGRDLLAALTVALTDPACHTVHLLTRDLPDRLHAVLRALHTLASGKTVNLFYLLDSGKQLNSKTQDYLQCLTCATRGSCYVIPVSLSGVLEKVIPLYTAESQPSSLPAVSPVKYGCQSTPVIMPHQHNTTSALFRSSLGNPLCPVTSCVIPGRTLSNVRFLPGCRVLARRRQDGFYYLGTLIQEVQGRRGVWVVEFYHSGNASLDVLSSHQQLVCSLDMVNHPRGHTFCIAPGDAVLSPWEPDQRRYGPGRVMAPTEYRECQGDRVAALWVLMWNGCVSVVPDGLVVPISAPHYDRIVRELQILKSVPSRFCNWMCDGTSPCIPKLNCINCHQSASSSCCCPFGNKWQDVSAHTPIDSHGRLSGFEKADIEKQLDLKDTDMMRSDPEVPSPYSSSLSEDETRMVFLPAVKLRSKDARPPWRYWRRIGSEPHHRQPGRTVPRRITQSHSASFSYPVPPTSASPNHSSLFQPLPGSEGTRANIKDVFGATNFRPRPPSGFRPFTGKSVGTVYA